MVKLLLDRGADIEAKDSDNRTALHSAALNGNVEVTPRSNSTTVRMNCLPSYIRAFSYRIE
jgi:ankyrin repeat protein